MCRVQTLKKQTGIQIMARVENSTLLTKYLRGKTKRECYYTSGP